MEEYVSDKHQYEQSEQKEKNENDLAFRLLKARTIYISGQVSQKMAKEVCAQLLVLEAESDDPIKVFVNSPGGHVESGDSIHDMLRYVKPKILCIGTGWVASAGVTIFLGTEKENRYCLPNTRFLIHQPSGGAMGSASDVKIEAEEIIKIRKRINELIARETGQSIEKVSKDTDRNFWMSAEEAKEYGLVNTIVESHGEIE